MFVNIVIFNSIDNVSINVGLLSPLQLYVIILNSQDFRGNSRARPMTFFLTLLPGLIRQPGFA